MLQPATTDDRDAQARVGAFLHSHALMVLPILNNVQIETRWAGVNAADIRRHAAELVALMPDVILAHNAIAVAPLLQMTRTIPIVFALAGDPVGAGLIDSLARPGGNTSGFMSYEFSVGGKWLELLKQIAPNVTRAGVLRDATQGSGTGQFAAIQASAQSLRMDVTPINMRDAGEVERGIMAFARSPNGGLISTPSSTTAFHRKLIITLAARHKLACSLFRTAFCAADGGLICLSNSISSSNIRQAAGYVDRVLKGERPADLPVQAPTKIRDGVEHEDRQGAWPASTFDIVLLGRADEVIE